jgi:hypothetical protein
MEIVRRTVKRASGKVLEVDGVPVGNGRGPNSELRLLAFKFRQQYRGCHWVMTSVLKHDGREGLALVPGSLRVAHRAEAVVDLTTRAVLKDRYAGVPGQELLPHHLDDIEQSAQNVTLHTLVRLAN